MHACVWHPCMRPCVCRVSLLLHLLRCVPTYLFVVKCIPYGTRITTLLTSTAEFVFPHKLAVESLGIVREYCRDGLIRMQKIVLFLFGDRIVR